MKEKQGDNSDSSDKGMKASQSDSGGQQIQTPLPQGSDGTDGAKPIKKMYVAPDVIQHKPLKTIMSEKAFAKAT
jgi:hypothetical protein